MKSMIKKWTVIVIKLLEVITNSYSIQIISQATANTA